MKALTEKIVHYLVLIAVTVFAIGVMWKLSAKDHLHGKQATVQVRPLSEYSAPKSPVAILPLQVQMCEILSTYAGKIQPWETYQIGFPIAGRIVSLGSNDSGRPLDDGDRVKAGQMLATMNDRAYRAHKSEAAAQIEKVTSDLQRAQRVRKSNLSAISESELQKLVTDLAIARAQHEIAVKNLGDATLRSPVDATISKRMIKSGESVNPNQVVFELVENDDVLLVVDVPETQIREIEQQKRALVKQQQDGASFNSQQSSDSVFRAYIQLEGRNRYGKPWPQMEGIVYRIPEIADTRTGLFAVEIQVDNSEHLLRPGMVATADIVTAHIPGYKIPQAAVIFRERKAYLFTVDRQSSEMEMLYWKLGQADLFRARRVDLNQWLDQGEHVIVPQEETELQSVVTRGQFRLADNQTVRIVNLAELSPGLNLQTTETRRISKALSE